MSSADDLIIDQLRRAQATEQASLSLIGGHLHNAPPGAYRTAARRHLDETRRHAHQVGERLTNLGATRDPIGALLTLGEAIVGRLAGVALAPLNLLAPRSEPDAVLRNVQDEIAAEAGEVATYEALERLANAAGDTATAALARAVRGDEERYLDTLRDVLVGLADRVVEQRLGARPRSRPQEPALHPRPKPRAPRTTNGGPVTTHRHVSREDAHVETEGAADPGPELHVSAPWDDYDGMKAGEIVERLRNADEAVRSMVRLYEQRNKSRKTVLQATEP
jgi:ferritin-like metal-binding protein YciE